MSFNNLGLSAELLRAVAEQGYRDPMPVQSRAIPPILAGKDVLARAQTGTGKTAGFTLPLLQRLNIPGLGKRRAIRTLILTPTRELAAQVEQSVRIYGRYLPLKAAVIFGGVGIRPQIDRLRRGVDVLVATPGRLLDHAERKTIDLSKVEIFVLDEADRMLDMGFIHDIRKIMTLLPEDPQTLLFSATFSDGIRELADSLLDSPARIEVAARNTTVEGVSQVIHPVDRQRKKALLSFLIKSKGWKKVLVFTRTKRGASRLSQQLERGGIKATAIHSDRSQQQRTRALADFKRGAVQVLVATDIAARGLDIDELPYVVNFEMPHVPEDYIHRIGRTARAGNQGDAVSLVCVDEDKQLKDVERLLNRDLPKVLISGYEPDPSLEARPAPNRRTPSRRVGVRSRRNDTPWRPRRPGRRMRQKGFAASPDSHNKEHFDEGRVEGNGRRPAKAHVHKSNRRRKVS